MLKKDLEIELKIVEKYADELRSKVQKLETENKKFDSQYKRIQSYIKNIITVLPELKGIFIGVDLPGDLPRNFINFYPDDYYNVNNRNRDAQTIFTVRDEIRVRIEYIERSLSNIETKINPESGY